MFVSLLGKDQRQSHQLKGGKCPAFFVYTSNRNHKLSRLPWNKDLCYFQDNNNLGTGDEMESQLKLIRSQR
jgi:hypothetical protein